MATGVYKLMSMTSIEPTITNITTTNGTGIHINGDTGWHFYNSPITYTSSFGSADTFMYQDPNTIKSKLASKLFQLYSKVLNEDEDYAEWLDGEFQSMLDLLLFES